MEAGELLLRGSIGLSLVCYAAAEWLRSRHGPISEVSARGAWTIAALACVAHAVLAFHFRHSWSHDLAYQDTARRTAALTGVAWGGGLYANYALLGVWTADAVWWWASPEAHLRRLAPLGAAVRAFVLFMFINGAVVFAHGAMRALGLAAVVMVVWTWYRRRPAEGRRDG